MGIHQKQGFTIIETVLVLAITGLLVIGILIGSSFGINQQRYNDSVNSLESLIQQQYSETTNVVNGRANNLACAADPSGVPTDRGRSDCFIVGRLIAIAPPSGVSTASQLTISNVVAYTQSLQSIPPSTTTADLLQYELRVSPVEEDKSEVAWGATIVNKNTTDPLSLRIFIARAPTLGSVMTFSGKPVSGQTLRDLVAATVSTDQQDLCIDPAGAVLAGHRRAVRIDKLASTAAAIEIPPEGDNVCN